MLRDIFYDVLPFLYVADEGSFRAAARRLGQTPAAVTRAIQRLEASVGVQLLIRTTRSVRLSPEGERFLQRCREAVTQIRTGRDELAMAQRDATGELRVSLSPALGSFLATHLPRFVKRYPDLQVHIHFTDTLSRLVDDAIDVAIRVGELEDSGLIARHLLTTRWVMVASPGYLEAHGIPQHPRDLQHHTCLKFRSPAGTLVDWHLQPRDPALRFSAQVTANQGAWLVEAAASGLGIAQAFGLMVRPLLRQGRLVRVLEPYTAPGPPVHALCMPGQQNTPRVRAFLDFLLDTRA